MYVGKCTKSILAVLLICGLLVVSVPCRAYAVGPVVLGPAIKYAIGAGIVAGGLYAKSKDDLNYVVNDYWNKASDHIKQQWQSAVIYGTGIGIITINDPLRKSINDYLEENYESGINDKLVRGEEHNAIEGQKYYKEGFWVNGHDITTRMEYGYTSSGSETADWIFEIDGIRIFRLQNYGGAAHQIKENWVKLWVEGSRLYCELSLWSVVNPDQRSTRYVTFSSLASDLGVSTLILRGADLSTYEFTGDSLGFGTVKPDDEVKVPCPPVPASEWLDRWLDELEEELNRTGNPTLDDETSIEEWEDDWDWYLDENGNIYKVKKGEPPKNPNDEPVRIPGPPLPAPDVPDDYPTEDDPDITIEHHPPETTITEHPDGSRTEITTQTTTTTKTWWDPTAERWRITIEETTTITTVEYGPDGTEIERTTETITQPKGEREETPQRDDTAINWEPLRRGLYELTEKFPFCLPWDLMRGVQTLESNQWDRKIEIGVGDGIWPEMIIDLTIFDEIARITRVILLVVFDLGLIFATRRLMGGDV